MTGIYLQECLIKNFDKEKLHAKQIEKADLKYPIEIYNHQGKWIILDGVHRFTKAVRLGYKTIKVRRISDDIVKKCKKDDKEWSKWKGKK